MKMKPTLADKVVKNLTTVVTIELFNISNKI